MRELEDSQDAEPPAASPESGPEPEYFPESEAPPTPESRPETDSHPEPEVHPEPEIASRPEPEPTPAPEVEPGLAAEPQPPTEPEPGPRPESSLELVPAPQPEPRPEPAPELVLKPEEPPAAAIEPPAPEAVLSPAAASAPYTDEASQLAPPSRPAVPTRLEPVQPALPRPISAYAEDSASEAPPEIYFDEPIPADELSLVLPNVPAAELRKPHITPPLPEAPAQAEPLSNLQLEPPAEPPPSAPKPEPPAEPEPIASLPPEPAAAQPEPAAKADPRRFTEPESVATLPPDAVVQPEPHPDPDLPTAPEPAPPVRPEQIVSEPAPAALPAEPPAEAASSQPSDPALAPAPPEPAPPLLTAAQSRFPMRTEPPPAPPYIPLPPIAPPPVRPPLPPAPFPAPPHATPAQPPIPAFVAPQAPPPRPPVTLDLTAELRHCETLFFTFKFQRLVELSTELIDRFPQCGDAYAYRSFALLGEGQLDPQQADPNQLELLLRDYYRACSGSIATQGATVCRLFLKLIFADLVKRIRQYERGAEVRLRKSDPLCGGAFALLDGDFDTARACFERAIADPASYTYACAGFGLLMLFQTDLAAAHEALLRAGPADEDIRTLAKAFEAVARLDAPPAPEPAAEPVSAPAPAAGVFEGDPEQLKTVLKVLNESSSYNDRQFQAAGARRDSNGRWEPPPRSPQVMQRCVRHADQLWSADFPPLSKRLQLRGADLSRRDFLGLRRTLALQKADLRNARLDGTAWHQVNLDQADFSDADLTCARFLGVQCEQTSFRNADLTGATLDLASTVYPVDFSGANLTRARIVFGRQFNEGVESFAPVRLHLTGANVEGLTVELIEPEAERAVESLQYLLSGLTPLQKARISIVNAPVPEITKTSGGRCFIATAACGSPYAAEVTELRGWRDQVLRPSPLGRHFIAWYERTSPPIAEWIAPRPRIRGLVRTVLIRPAAAIVRALRG